MIVDDGRASPARSCSTLRASGCTCPPLVWSVQYRFSADAALAVLASDPYDAADYIRDYEEFLRLPVNRGGAARPDR